MTVKELRMFLEEMEKEGKGDCKICVVSSENCEPIGDYSKYVTDITPYYDGIDGTVTITDQLKEKIFKKVLTFWKRYDIIYT